MVEELPNRIAYENIYKVYTKKFDNLWNSYKEILFLHLTSFFFITD